MSYLKRGEEEMIVTPIDVWAEKDFME